MKRTNVVLDEKLLEEAQKLSGEKTYSATINRALDEMIKRIHVRGLNELIGRDVWEGAPHEIPPGHDLYDELMAEALEREARGGWTQGRRSAFVISDSHRAKPAAKMPKRGKNRRDPR